MARMSKREKLVRQMADKETVPKKARYENYQDLVKCVTKDFPEPGDFQRFTDRFIHIFVQDNATVTEAVKRAAPHIPSTRVRALAQELQDGLSARASVVQGLLYGHIEEIYARAEVTRDSHLAMLAKIRDAAFKDSDYGSALAAEKARGQVGGLYVDRKHIVTQDATKMGAKEVTERLKQLLAKDPTLLDEIAPETILKETNKIVDVEEVDVFDMDEETKE